MGMYFGHVKNNELRLSIEGSQLLHKSAKKNVLELDDENAKKWMDGQDIDMETSKNGFQIIANNGSALGCGKISKEKLLNFVPKERRC